MKQSKPLTNFDRDQLYYAAMEKCVERYDRWVDVAFLRKGVADRLPLRKLNRWLGFVQGLAIAGGHTTVKAERDWSRPLFRPLDFPIA